MDRDYGRACGNFTFILKLYCEMKGRRKTSFTCVGELYYQVQHLTKK